MIKDLAVIRVMNDLFDRGIINDRYSDEIELKVIDKVYYSDVLYEIVYGIYLNGSIVGKYFAPLPRYRIEIDFL